MKLAILDKEEFLKGKWDNWKTFFKEKCLLAGFAKDRKVRHVYSSKYKDIWVQEPDDTKFFDDNPSMGSLSDGYHTFDELYDHRNLLFINLCIEKMREYSQGEEWVDNCTWWKFDPNTKGWFILTLEKEKGRQISYHIQEKYLPLVKAAKIPNKEIAFDGHNSKDVLVRLEEMAR